MVVEGEERHTEFLHELEGRGHLGAGRRHRVERRIEPWPIEGPLAEDIVARPVERVPVAHGQPQVFRQGLVAHDPVPVVPAVTQRIIAVGSGVADCVDICEELGHGPEPSDLSSKTIDG